MLTFYLKGAIAMNKKEFVEAILKANKETTITVCHLLKADPQLFEQKDLHSGNTHKAF